MIYQCYFKKDQEPDLFKNSCYEPFGLEPEVNKDLFLNCHELEEPFVRLQLTEYACFLWHWRNKDKCPNDWVGSTSFRQLDKFPHIFKDLEQVDSLVSEHGVVGWGEYDLLNRVGSPITLKKQTEVCHPGLNKYISDVLNMHGHTLPSNWDQHTSGFFANYWVMTRQLFDNFMEFSWPMVKWSLENVKDSEYYKKGTKYGTVSNAKATGYFMERLFLIWYLSEGKTPHNPFRFRLNLVHDTL
tara:strand:- start:239 stop:964 length:726 start_codon:yes stop_codon:yes gene_type:complete